MPTSCRRPSVLLFRLLCCMEFVFNMIWKYRKHDIWLEIIPQFPDLYINSVKQSNRIHYSIDILAWNK